MSVEYDTIPDLIYPNELLSAIDDKYLQVEPTEQTLARGVWEELGISCKTDLKQIFLDSNFSVNGKDVIFE